MQTIKYFLTFTLILIVSFGLSAQRSKLKKAERLMGKFQYKDAIEIYKSILNKGNDGDATLGIAECYRIIGNSDESEYWYSMIIMMPNPPSNARLYYAQALHQNGKLKKAKKQVEIFLKDNVDHYQAHFLLKACSDDAVAELNASQKLYKLTNCEDINTEQDEYAPNIYKDDLVYVSSTGKGRKVWKKAFNQWTDKEKKNYTNIYTVPRERNQVDDKILYSHNTKKIKLFSSDLTQKYHDGPLTFDKDFSEVYVTRSSLSKIKKSETRTLEIYNAKGNPGKYVNMRALPFVESGASYIHPTLSSDGKMLIFASNINAELNDTIIGGYGGYDLYVSYWETDRWSPPENLGGDVNTEGNELFPFYHTNHKAEGTLYFASDGHTGLGGLDIYSTQNSYEYWMTPENLGSPINSADDDFGIVLTPHGEHGYISSNRPSSKAKGGDDIYQFSKLSTEIEILVLDSLTNMPIPSAEIYTFCAHNKRFITDEKGISSVELPLNKNCDIAAEAMGFKPNSAMVSTMKMTPGDTKRITIRLVSECQFTLAGQVVDGNSNKPVEGALVLIRTDCDSEQDEFEVMTDSSGRYEFTDLREDCDIQVSVSKDGFTDGSVTFRTGIECGERFAQNNPDLVDSLGRMVQVIPLFCFEGDCEQGTIDNPATAGKEVCDSIMLEDGSIKTVFCDSSFVITDTDNRQIAFDKDGNTVETPGETGRAELVHIFYDYDDARIRKDAFSSLNELVALMNKFSEMKVQITSHTDSRGTKSYNKRLSKRRAESVVRYLIKNGIDKKRLKASGKGETITVNECYDGVECTEEQHQENRRTEFMILEYTGEGIPTGSTKPSNIKTKPCKGCPSASEVEVSEDEDESSFDEDFE